MTWKSLCRVQLFVTPWTIQLMEFYRPEYCLGSLSLLQGIFPKGSNPYLPHCRWILYQLSHRGSPRILQWVALSPPQRIFLTQESKQGLLHCRWILYQLSYQGFLGDYIKWDMQNTDKEDRTQNCMYIVITVMERNNTKNKVDIVSIKMLTSELGWWD